MGLGVGLEKKPGTRFEFWGSRWGWTDTLHSHTQTCNEPATSISIEKSVYIRPSVPGMSESSNFAVSSYQN